MKNKKASSINQVSTLFLRAALLGMAVVAVILCILILPAIFWHWTEEFPDLAYARYPLVFALSTAAVSFFAALYQASKLLNLIDADKTFSIRSVMALKNIRYCGFTIGSLFVACMPIVYIIGDREDAPGIIVIGMILSCAPIVIGVFAAVIQRVLQNAIDIKSENDLTV